MGKASISTGRKWSMIILLAFFGRAIANVPYMREVYYDQVIEVLHINNTQLGVLSSAVGIASIFGYFFGGILADRFSSKKIIMLSGVLGGIITLWYASFPSFSMLIVIHAAIALDGTLLFWAAYVRILRLIGTKEEQGKNYGFAEGIRSFIGIILPMICTTLMAQSTLIATGFRNVLIFYAASYFATSILGFFLLVDVSDSGEKEEKVKYSGKDYLALLKTPGLWLVAFLIFGTYTVFSLQTYSTPYMTNVCGMSMKTVSTIASIRQYGIGLAAMPIMGIVADNVIKSPAKTCLIGACALLPCALGMLLCPSSMQVILVVMILVIGFLAQGIRGVYYATQDEAKIPIHLAGAAAGIISTIGFSPDAFIFAQVGGWLDKYSPEQAYRMIWIYMMVGCAIAIISAAGICRLSNKNK